jgi:hypothetical protein
MPSMPLRQSLLQKKVIVPSTSRALRSPSDWNAQTPTRRRPIQSVTRRCPCPPNASSSGSVPRHARQTGGITGLRARLGGRADRSNQLPASIYSRGAGAGVSTMIRRGRGAGGSRGSGGTRRWPAVPASVRFSQPPPNPSAPLISEHGGGERANEGFDSL